MAQSNYIFRNFQETTAENLWNVDYEAYFYRNPVVKDENGILVMHKNGKEEEQVKFTPQDYLDLWLTLDKYQGYIISPRRTDNVNYCVLFYHKIGNNPEFITIPLLEDQPNCIYYNYTDVVMNLLLFEQSLYIEDGAEELMEAFRKIGKEVIPLSKRITPLFEPIDNRLIGDCESMPVYPYIHYTSLKGYYKSICHLRLPNRSCIIATGEKQGIFSYTTKDTTNDTSGDIFSYIRSIANYFGK